MKQVLRFDIDAEIENFTDGCLRRTLQTAAFLRRHIFPVCFSHGKPEARRH